MIAVREIPRIAYLVDTFPSRSETFVAQEISCLTADCGADITLFALKHGADGLSVPVETIYLTSKDASAASAVAVSSFALAANAMSLAGGARHFPSALRYAKSARRLAAELSRRGIRHVHAHFASLPTTVALLAARLVPVTVSFSAHAEDIYLSQRGLAEKLSRARLCITCAQANAAFLRALARPADAGKVACVYHGTDLSLFAFRPRTERSSAARLLAAGRLVPKKGFETLLRACALLKARRELTSEVVGDGLSRGRLEKLARKLGIATAVQFTGWQSYGSMPDAYARADILVVPSIQTRDGNRDALPNVTIEAMASGTPVVASDIAGIPEAIKDGLTGLLCPPGDARALADAIERILEDRVLRDRIVSNARALAEELFDCRRSARAIHELLKRAANSS